LTTKPQAVLGVQPWHGGIHCNRQQVMAASHFYSLLEIYELKYRQQTQIFFEHQISHYMILPCMRKGWLSQSADRLLAGTGDPVVDPLFAIVTSSTPTPSSTHQNFSLHPVLSPSVVRCKADSSALIDFRFLSAANKRHEEDNLH
jgi:hypothetical protein